MSLDRVNIDLTDKIIKSLVSGKSTQIPASLVKGSGAMLYVHPATAKKVRAAKKKGGAVRIQLTMPEIEASGLMDWLKGAAQTVGKFAKEKALPFVKETILPAVKTALAPVIKEQASKAVDVGVKKLGQRSKFLGDIAASQQGALVDVIGKQTGAYGMQPPPQPLIMPEPGSYYAVTYHMKGGSFRTI